MILTVSGDLLFLMRLQLTRQDWLVFRQDEQAQFHLKLHHSFRDALIAGFVDAAPMKIILGFHVGVSSTCRARRVVFRHERLSALLSL